MFKSKYIIWIICLLLGIITLPPIVLPSYFSYFRTQPWQFFWRDIKETAGLIASWSDEAEARQLINIAEQRIKEYKKYQAEANIEEADNSLVEYGRKIDLLLKFLSKDRDPKESEAIAGQTKQYLENLLIELNQYSSQLKPEQKVFLQKAASKTESAYVVTVTLLEGGYHGQVVGWFQKMQSAITNFVKKAYEKLWPLSEKKI